MPAPAGEVPPAQRAGLPDRRRAARRVVTIRPYHVAVLRPSGWQCVHVTVLDLSSGGLLLEAREPLSVDDYLRFSFGLPGATGQVLVVDVAVCRVEPPREAPGGPWRAGCDFVEAPADVSTRIARFVGGG